MITYTLRNALRKGRSALILKKRLLAAGVVHTASHQADAPQVSFTLPAGVYVLKADDGTERKTAKLIIR